jgi:aminoglycoside phosphotransferase (APT) family kinase protein
MAQQQPEMILEALVRWVKSTDTSLNFFTKVKKIIGGYSNLTFLIETDRQEQYVLRMPPPGAGDVKKGHDVIREYKILQALNAAGYAYIPQPMAACEDIDFLGAPFYIMEWVEGPIVRVADPSVWRDWSAERWQDISTSFCQQLVALHALDIEASGLIQIGKPDGYIQRQVEGWSKRYEAAQTDDLPDMTALMAYLQAKIPSEIAPTLLHNDFKYDNAILDLTGDSVRIKALLDWEMTTVGDPRMDLGAAMAYWVEPEDSRFERSFNTTWLAGNMTRSQFIAEYERLSGRQCADMLYFYVFGLFKNAVIMQQIYRRYKLGQSTDERFAGLIDGVRILSKKGVVALERGVI